VKTIFEGNLVLLYKIYTVSKKCVQGFQKSIICTMIAGADPGFQVRGGALKKIAPNRGRRENVCGISCEKSRFYAKIAKKKSRNIYI
jgi:hypothetical protein